MTDVADTAPDTRAIVKRRLVGLVVLLLIASLLSVLLRARPATQDALPSVIIPLGGTAPTGDPALAAATAPLLDEPEVPSLAQTAPATAAKEPATNKPEPARPTAAAKPAAAPAKAPVEKTADAATTKKPAATSKPAAPAKAESAAARWFVAVGAYKDPMAAQAIVSRVKQAGYGATATAVSSAGERLHRVRAGPFASREAAESARATLIVEGLTKAAIVSEK